ncbi:hypothetical protein ACJ72_07771 [Emergomyces africanus]|uniref:Uncharacterized protein n=1 Tax=Emergomyces africanus TaxID=1955775 RepID=A0A1B7NM75_9EURO|nr:hypothetical protein ACJ72_07771 [Emergomyces africanus]
MRFFYSFLVLNGIAATVLSVPIRDPRGSASNIEQKSRSIAARVVNPLYITQAADRKPRNGCMTPENRGNEKRQDSFGYSHYDNKLEMEKGQCGHGSNDATVKMKRQGDFGHPNYDAKPWKERRQFDYASYDKPENAKRQDRFGYSDYDDKPEKKRRQFGYDDYDSEEHSK